jgi:MFS family permease
MSRASASWFAAALFFFFAFLTRLAPGVLADDLMKALQLEAADLASLSAWTLGAYALAQIPSGILIDRRGMRFMIFVSSSLCMLGTWIFSGATALWQAQCGRILIGVGSASGFLIAGKVSTSFFCERKAPFMLGLLMGAGTLGAMTAGPPLAWAAERWGWRETLAGMSLFGLLPMLLSSVLFSAYHPVKGSKTHYKNLAFKLVRSGSFWLISSFAVVAYMPVNLMDAWGVSFLMRSRHLSPLSASEYIMVLYFGLALGSTLIPLTLSFWNEPKRILLISMLLMLVSAGLLIECLSLPSYGMLAGFFVLGFFAGVELLGYSEGMKQVRLGDAAFAAGWINTLEMALGALGQLMLGKILDASKVASHSLTSLEAYSVSNFQNGFRLLECFLLFGVCATLAYFRLRPCRVM